jgi:hypothetical protein
LAVNEELRQKVITSVCVSSLFGFTIFFFGPAYLYFTNILEFTSSFLEIAPIFLAMSLLCGLLTTMILLALRGSTHEKAAAVVLALSFLLWIQGNIIVWQYGPLDGREIDWGSNWAYGLIDGAIWIGLLIAAFRASAQIHKMAQRAVMVYLLIQIVSTIFIAISAEDAAHLHEQTVEDKDAIFRFSSEKNVVILVLDQFQTDIFHEIINESLHYRDIFDGAIYYRNAVAAYPHTFASITAILSGRFYENSVPLQDFIKREFTEESLPKVFKDNGYQVDLVGGGQYLYADNTIASNRIEIKYLVDRNAEIKEAAFVLDLSLFRYLPHFLKRYVYNNQAWFVSNLRLDKAFGDFPAGKHRDGILFMEKMAREVKAGNDRPTFKYLHLLIPHMPVRFNERLEYVELDQTRDNYIGQAKGTLNLVNMFIGRLKHIDAYDNTLLFIIADHGAGGKVELEHSGRAESGKAPRLSDLFKGGALPLLLVKPFGARGELKISDAPVSSADIPRTIVAELGIDAEMPGVSIFDLEESADRERRFLHHDWNVGDKQRYSPYLPPLEEYTVKGFSWLDESWNSTGRIFSSEGIKEKTVQN